MVAIIAIDVDRRIVLVVGGYDFGGFMARSDYERYLRAYALLFQVPYWVRCVFSPGRESETDWDHSSTAVIKRHPRFSQRAVGGSRAMSEQ